MDTELNENLYLLYINGEDMNHNVVASIVKGVPNFALGPFCWLIGLERAERHRFLAQMMVAVPDLRQKAEVLLSPVGDILLECQHGGFGLSDWVNKKAIKK